MFDATKTNTNRIWNVTRNKYKFKYKFKYRFFFVAYIEDPKCDSSITTTKYSFKIQLYKVTFKYKYKYKLEYTRITVLENHVNSSNALSHIYSEKNETHTENP